MRVLLTGATGLIGQSIGQKLVASGHRVTSLVRNLDRAKAQLTFPCELREWKTFATPPRLGEQDKFDAVIHLAGEPVAEKRWSAEQKAKIRDSRVIGTQILREALKEQELSVWVQGSAIGYYGNNGEAFCDEDSQVGSDFLARVVAEWEGEAKQARAERIVFVRTGIVLSLHGGALTKMLEVFQKGVGGKLGNGQQYFSWIHLDDIARLFVFALENPNVEGVVNGSAPEPVSNAELTKRLAKATGRREFLPVPAQALRIALGEMSEALLGSIRATTRAPKLGFRFNFPTLEEALKHLCRGMEDGSRVFEVEQYVHQPREKIFEYFSSERNLEVITPRFLNFKVLGSSTEKVRQGTLIDYQLSLYGVPFKWKTLIEEWKPSEKFVDVQLKGPYRLWHHTHEFTELGNGTLIKDRVLFKLPMGVVGDAIASSKVLKDVNAIFNFRQKKIAEIFGS